MQCLPSWYRFDNTKSSLDIIEGDSCSCSMLLERTSLGPYFGRLGARDRHLYTTAWIRDASVPLNAYHLFWRVPLGVQPP